MCASPSTAQDGDTVSKGQKLALLEGDMRVLLTGERTALNYLQRMSGHCYLHSQNSSLIKRHCCQTVGYPQNHAQYAYF